MTFCARGLVLISIVSAANPALFISDGCCGALRFSSVGVNDVEVEVAT